MTRLDIRGLVKNANRLHWLAALSNLLTGAKYLLAYGQRPNSARVTGN